MPVDRRIRMEIDYRFSRLPNEEEIFFHLDAFLEDILALLSLRPNDAQATAAYLSYSLSRTFMHRNNDTQQAELAAGLTTLLRRLYNEPRVQAMLSAAPRAQAFTLLLRLYNIHCALLMNGLRSARGPLMLDAFDALRLLQIALTAAWGPWHALLRLGGGIRDYYHARLQQPLGGLQIEIGRTPSRGAPVVDLRVATFNMQGSSEITSTKYRSHVLPLVRMHHVLALQEAGVAPFTAQHVARLDIADQFGVPHEVNQYIWDPGSLARPERYQLFMLEVERLRVRLAMVVPEQVDVRSVIVIADGVRRPSGAAQPRPVLGLRLRLAGLAEEVTVLNFHAISNGGANCPWMLREVSWHCGRYVLVGDFNREPQTAGPLDPQQGNWISPPGIAELVPANGPTHPSQGPSRMLDYALVNGTSQPANPGVVGQVADSDHRSVSFTFTFSNY